MNLLYPLCFLYFKSLRIEAVISNEVEKKIQKGMLLFSNYHSQILPFIGYYRNSGYSVLISKSSDGDIANYIMSRFNYNIVRGSSSEGANEALDEIEGLLKGEDKCKSIISLTFDGPKGPKYKIKTGILWLAKTYKCPILFASCYFSKAKRLRSWDKLYIPYPFSKMLIVIEDPIYFEKSLSKKNRAASREYIDEICWNRYKRGMEVYREKMGKYPLNIEDIDDMSDK